MRSVWLRHQRFPSASESTLEPQHRSQKDVELSRFNFLKRSDVEIGHLGEPFLRQSAQASLAPETSSETSQFGFFSFGGWHASLRRNKSVDVNGATGRNLHPQGKV